MALTVICADAQSGVLRKLTKLPKLPPREGRHPGSGQRRVRIPAGPPATCTHMACTGGNPGFSPCIGFSPGFSPCTDRLPEGFPPRAGFPAGFPAEPPVRRHVEDVFIYIASKMRPDFGCLQVGVSGSFKRKGKKGRRLSTSGPHSSSILRSFGALPQGQDLIDACWL